MIILPLTVEFKGARDYIQGGDIHDAVLAALSAASIPVATFRLKIGRFAGAALELHLSESAEEARSRPAGCVADIVVGPGARAGWVVESGQPVVGRRDFPEELIVARSRIDGDGVSMLGDPGFSPIEVVIAITKHLHQQIRPQPQRRWIFTGIDLRRPLADSDRPHLAVILRQTLGTHLTRSILTSGDEELGSIFFSAVDR